jgi:hypothetical protein
MDESAMELEHAFDQVEHATDGETMAAMIAELESDNGPIDEGLVQQYSRLMEEFVRRKTQKLVLDRLAEQGGGGALSLPDPNDDAEAEPARAVRRERHQQVLSRLRSTFDELQQKVELFKIQQSALRAQKRDLMERADEFRRAQEDRLERELFGGDGSAGAGGSPGGDEEVDDAGDDVDPDELDREGERLLAIQRRSAELQAEIEKYKSKNLKLSRSLLVNSENLPPEVRQCLSDQAPVTDATKSAVTTLLQQLKEQNAQMEAAIEQHSEMTEFYTGMRECLEELRGVRVLHVKNALSSGSGSRSGRRQSLKCAFLLLDEYELEVELQALDPAHAATGGEQQSQQLFPVKAAFRNLNLSLDDLVMSSKKSPSSSDLYLYSNGADRLRRIVTEALARIHVHQQRARQLEQLQAVPGIQVAVAGRGSDGGAAEGQDGPATSPADSQWVCRIQTAGRESAAAADDAAAASGWVAVLSLTPDCPLIPGSVRLAHLYHMNDEGVEDTQSESTNVLNRINETPYSSPIELVLQLSKELRG